MSSNTLFGRSLANLPGGPQVVAALGSVAGRTIAAAGAGAALGGAAGFIAGRTTRGSTSTRPASRRRHGSQKRAAKPRRSGKAPKRHNRRGGAVKDRYGGRKVYRTKRGQPYVLKANGQARFIKA